MHDARCGGAFRSRAPPRSFASFASVLSRRIDAQVRLPLRRQVREQIVAELVAQTSPRRIAPQVLALQRVVREVVELAFAAVVAWRRRAAQPHAIVEGEAS